MTSRECSRRTGSMVGCKDTDADGGYAMSPRLNFFLMLIQKRLFSSELQANLFWINNLYY